MRQEVQRFGEHRNAFGFLRLLFASLVILSHTPELADGDRSREILTRVFGSISFGEFSVDGFFVISGFLITGSWLKNPRLWPYLRKRIARIYPAFVVCFLLCVLVIAPLGDAPVSAIRANALINLKAIAILQPPIAPGVFSGSSYELLNGSAWTIAYEFRCYVLVAVLGSTGVLRRPLAVPLLAASLYGAHVLIPPTQIELIQHFPFYEALFGELDRTLRLTPIFLTGAWFFLNRKSIPLNGFVAAASGLALIAALNIGVLTATAATAVFGGYLIVFFAHRAKGLFASINNRNDVSYGLYLYAWPVEKLAFWYFPTAPMILIGAGTLVISYGFGWLSWRLIEKPVLQRFGREASNRQTLVGEPLAATV